MINLKVVTGYVPIPGHPRTAETYGKWGENFKLLKDAGIPVHPWYSQPLDLWLYRRLVTMKDYPTIWPARADNPAKNTIAYHCVQHQKFNWLCASEILDHHAHDTYVWMDYGIWGSIPGVTPEIVIDFLNRIKKDDFAIPGCWEKTDAAKALDYPLDWPCWRFCGGVLVVPVKELQHLFHVVREEILSIMDFHRTITFEVNTLARCEAKGLIEPRWYLADHNQTMFTGY